MPEEQYTIDQGAIVDHEVFMAWVKAGFTREEALRLLLALKFNVYNENGKEQ
jgi:hypothetical protein